MTNEQIRLEEARERKAPWKKWDPTSVNHLPAAVPRRGAHKTAAGGAEALEVFRVHNDDDLHPNTDLETKFKVR